MLVQVCLSIELLGKSLPPAFSASLKRVTDSGRWGRGVGGGRGPESQIVMHWTTWECNSFKLSKTFQSFYLSYWKAQTFFNVSKGAKKRERRCLPCPNPSSLVEAAKQAGAAPRSGGGVRRLWGQDTSRPPVLWRRSRDRESQGKQGRARREGGGRQAGASSSSRAQASPPQLLFLEAAAPGAGSREK